MARIYLRALKLRQWQWLAFDTKFRRRSLLLILLQLLLLLLLQLLLLLLLIVLINTFPQKTIPQPLCSRAGRGAVHVAVLGRRRFKRQP